MSTMMHIPISVVLIVAESVVSYLSIFVQFSIFCFGICVTYRMCIHKYIISAFTCVHSQVCSYDKYVVCLSVYIHTYVVPTSM